MTEKKQPPPEIGHLVRDEHACYVLITCEKPTEDGKMHVELTYEGDPILAAYLLESAQTFIEPDEGVVCN